MLVMVEMEEGGGEGRATLVPHGVDKGNVVGLPGGSGGSSKIITMKQIPKQGEDNTVIMMVPLIIEAVMYRHQEEAALTMIVSHNVRKVMTTSHRWTWQHKTKLGKDHHHVLVTMMMEKKMVIPDQYMVCTIMAMKMKMMAVLGIMQTWIQDPKINMMRRNVESIIFGNNSNGRIVSDINSMLHWDCSLQHRHRRQQKLKQRIMTI
mmetsp:Transcript_21929/g.47622  ORF Transcript_21929/g.47622 Transcript_21929/m.47622 type:complete len:206 (+) Transcript_21929:583-1200(+)